MRTGRSVLAMRLLDGFVPTGLRRKPLRSWRARQFELVTSAFGACHYLGEKMVLRQAQFVANEAVRSTGLRAGARVGALFAAPGRSCRQASSCTMIRSRWPDRSASGKRDSSAQRQTAQNRLQARNGLRGDRNAAAKARQLRASWPSPGNLAVRKSAWWAREDSNLQPDRYEAGGSDDWASGPIARGSGAAPSDPSPVQCRPGAAIAPDAQWPSRVLPICSLRSKALG